MKNSVKRLLIAAAALVSAAARAEIAVVVHPDNPRASMTAEEVASVYVGRDAHLEPIDLPESASMHHWFYYKVTGRDATQIKIRRAQLLAQRTSPKVVSNSVEAIRRVAANKRAIAYVDQRTVDASVKVVMTIQSPALLDRLGAHN